jgi:hypothetical protein
VDGVPVLGWRVLPLPFADIEPVAAQLRSLAAQAPAAEAPAAEAPAAEAPARAGTGR